jgi:hypothetical protein
MQVLRNDQVNLSEGKAYSSRKIIFVTKCLKILQLNKKGKAVGMLLKDSG